LLTEISKDAFTSTDRLEEIYLNDNSLFLNDSTSAVAFLKLINLEVLSIHNNLAFNEDLLDNLSMLNTLSVDRSVNVTFGSVFFSLIHLDSLTIYGRMTNLNNDTFENLWNCSLKELSIKSQNTLSVLQPLTFAPLSSLEKLDLSYNRGVGFESVSKAWYGLKFTNISTLILTRIISDTEVGPTLKNSFYTDLVHSNITTFIISRNNIVAIDSGLADAVPKVRHIDFSNNRLSNIGTVANEIYSMKNLLVMDFSYQSKRYLNKRRINYNKKILEPYSLLNLTRSENKTTSECEISPLKPCTFTLGSNHTEDFPAGPLSDFGPWCLQLPSHLEAANLSASINVQLDQFPQVFILGSNRHLREFIYKANGFSRCVGPLIINNCNPGLALTFDLSDNEMTCIAPDLLKISINSGCNIGAMVRANNDLGGQLERDINRRVFRLYSNLTELNLVKNSIKSLPFKIFENLKVLEYLNLSGNSLRKIDFEFKHFQCMNVLDMSNNLITSLSMDILDNLQNLFIQSNMTIDSSANPIQCSCETLPFLRWMENKKGNLAKFKAISCLINDKLVTFESLQIQILSKLEFECASNVILQISSGLLGFGLLTVAVSVFLYRHRWDIRYFFLNLTARRNQDQLVREKLTSFIYDAFVSYDHRDIEWVRNELIKCTETPTSDDAGMTPRSNGLSIRPLKLCIHGRDFIPGETIEENILKAIKASRKVILIVTENFLRSEWCKFELEIAVMLTSVNMRDMPSALQSLVRRRTYVNWEQDSSDKTEFWKSLRKALADSGVVPWVCECGKTVNNVDCSD